MNLGRLKYWFLLASRFLAGQGIIQFLNMATGLLLIHLLPVEEFALYSLAGAMLAVGSLGSNLGLTSALITLGSRVKDDPTRLGRLFATITKYRVSLFAVVTILILCLLPVMARGRGWAWWGVGLSALLVVASNWVQLTQSLRICVLNIHHDADSLWVSGMTGAVTRLSLTALCCWRLPSTIMALSINLLGFIAAEVILIRRSRRYMSETAPADRQVGESVKNFVYPLVPGVIYYALRWHISFILLGFFGKTTSIADYGALGRLGQAIGLIGLLNVFLVQPYFARISVKTDFIKKSSAVLCAYTIIAVLLISSAYLVPGWWLLLIGSDYIELKPLLPLAFSIPLLAMFGDILYILLMSRGWTRGQNWTIYLGICVQVLFIVHTRVDTTQAALQLSFCALSVHAVVQLALLLKNLTKSKLTWVGEVQIQSR